MNTLARLATVSLGLALSACAPDPIVGTWRNSVDVLGSPVTADFTFGADHTFTTATRFTYPADAPTFASCTQITRTSGTNWSTSSMSSGMTTTMTLTLTPSAMPGVTLERSGCHDAVDDVPPTQQDPSAQGMTTESTYTFTIANDQLSLTSTGNGMASTTVFTRVTETM